MHLSDCLWEKSHETTGNEVSYTGLVPWSFIGHMGESPLKTGNEKAQLRAVLTKTILELRVAFPSYAEDRAFTPLVDLSHMAIYWSRSQRDDFHWFSCIRIGRDRQGDVNIADVIFGSPSGRRKQAAGRKRYCVIALPGEMFKNFWCTLMWSKDK